LSRSHRPSPPDLSPRPLPDALPICGALPYLLIPIATQLFFNQVIGLYGPVWRYASVEEAVRVVAAVCAGIFVSTFELAWYADIRDRKSTRLNSSHQIISYAVFRVCK